MESLILPLFVHDFCFQQAAIFNLVSKKHQVLALFHFFSPRETSLQYQSCFSLYPLFLGHFVQAQRILGLYFTILLGISFASSLYWIPVFRVSCSFLKRGTTEVRFLRFCMSKYFTFDLLAQLSIEFYDGNHKL